MIVKITLTTAGIDTGPFNIFSDADNFATPIVTGVSKSSLIAGYDVVNTPDAATIMRVTSTGTCTNSINIPITVTYVMVLGRDYDSVGQACAGTTTPTQTVTYVGNLGIATEIPDIVYQGDVGFLKIISSTQPGFTLVGRILGFANGSYFVSSIDTCP